MACYYSTVSQVSPRAAASLCACTDMACSNALGYYSGLSKNWLIKYRSHSPVGTAHYTMNRPHTLFTTQSNNLSSEGKCF